MLLRQLEYLVALARERHFARAAAACYVSQPSLSAAIRKLEHELDVPIVRRGRRYEGLTPEGERVLAWAHRILAERDALEQELAALRGGGGLSGTLRMGAIPTALTAASLLTTPFCDRHAGVRVTVESLSSREITDRLGEFELDVAMTYLDDDTLLHVRKYPLYEERYVLITPEGGDLRGTARWAQAAALPLCLLAPRMRNRQIMDECFAADGATASPVVESDTVAGLYAHLAASGRWSSVISHAWLHMFGVPEGLRVVPMEGPAHGPRVGLVVADHDPESVLAGALLEVARQARVRDALDELLTSYLGR